MSGTQSILAGPSALSNTSSDLSISSTGSLSFGHGTNMFMFSTQISNFSFATWYHVCVSYYDPTWTGTIYVNGINQLQSNSSQLSPPWMGGETVYLGGQPFQTYAFSGSVQCLQWYNSSLGEVQVKAVYNGQKAGTCGDTFDYVNTTLQSM